MECDTMSDLRSEKIDSNECYSDMCSEDFDAQNSGRIKFTCWDEIDAAWMECAKRDTDNLIYVHEEILEWIVEHINEKILNINLRATVEEVYHHNLRGRVYLITFFDRYSRMTSKYTILEKIKSLLTYKMPWKAKRTYFLRIDSQFDATRLMLIDFLQNHNLGGLINITTLEVNWMYIPKIEIYEFPDNISDSTMNEIDAIFRRILNKKLVPIYICDQFEWHRTLTNYIEIDYLAMDICAEEWKRFDLLKDFSVPEVLCLDLANKDHRDPNLNEYLDRYLNILIHESLPEMASNHGRSLKYSFEKCPNYLGSYFVSRFHDKIAMLCCFDRRVLESFIEYTPYDIPTNPRCNKEIYLTGDQPHPDTLLAIKCHKVKYVIRNYTHMSDSLLRALLNRSKQIQTFMFKFDTQFNFEYESEKPGSSLVPNDFYSGSSTKLVFIELNDCIDSNAEHLGTFVQYLTGLFNEISKPDVKVAMHFNNCMLDDYTCLDNIGSGYDTIYFNSMSFSPSQIKILSRALIQLEMVVFLNCQHITDMQVMMLLENIGLEHLRMRGNNSCTPGIYFLIAEYLMVKQDVDTIRAEWIFGTLQCWDEIVRKKLEHIDFVVDYDQIVGRNRITTKILDFYCFWNNDNEDHFDVTNNIYAE